MFHPFAQSLLGQSFAMPDPEGYFPKFGKVFASDRRTVIFVGGVLNLQVRKLPIEQGSQLPGIIQNAVSMEDGKALPFCERYHCLPMMNCFGNIAPVYLLEGVPIPKCRQILAQSEYWALLQCDSDGHWEACASQMPKKP